MSGPAAMPRPSAASYRTIAWPTEPLRGADDGGEGGGDEQGVAEPPDRPEAR